MKQPVFIIHDLSHAMAVAKVAEETGRPAIVQSAPGLATTLGPEGFLALIDEVDKSFRKNLVHGVLDCGCEPAVALGALRRGARMITVDLNDDLLQKVSDIARQYDGEIFTTPDEALDVLDLENMHKDILHHFADGNQS